MINSITKEMKDIAKQEIEKRRKEEINILKVKTSEERKKINTKYDELIKQINRTLIELIYTNRFFLTQYIVKG